LERECRRNISGELSRPSECAGELRKYKGSDTFAIKATGQGPAASGSSVITVNATIK